MRQSAFCRGLAQMPHPTFIAIPSLAVNPNLNLNLHRNLDEAEVVFPPVSPKCPAITFTAIPCLALNLDPNLKLNLNLNEAE
jgi:hypothetical protein